MLYDLNVDFEISSLRKVFKRRFCSLKGLDIGSVALVAFEKVLLKKSVREFFRIFGGDLVDSDLIEDGFVVKKKRSKKIFQIVRLLFSFGEFFCLKVYFYIVRQYIMYVFDLIILKLKNLFVKLR